MLEMIDIGVENAVAYRFGGKITEEEMTAVLAVFKERIEKGEKLNEVININPKLFPPVVSQMVAIGEETGELVNILAELAEFYEDEVDQIMENLPAIIEPVLILVLGLGVGGVAVAVIMPMYSLTTAI